MLPDNVFGALQFLEVAIKGAALEENEHVRPCSVPHQSEPQNSDILHMGQLLYFDRGPPNIAASCQEGNSFWVRMIVLSKLRKYLKDLTALEATGEWTF